jgi:hypothetical protein
MKSISIYISLLLSIVFLSNVHSQEGGDAVFNKLLCEYTLHADGSTSYHEYKEVALLSHMSFHRLFGETFIIYDPRQQDLKINEAYTIMADGKKVVVPDNAFNEVLPRAASHAAPYNHLREMVITHTGLEVGATIYLDYTLTSKPGYMKTFMGEEVIQSMVPIREKEIIINIPSGQELHYKMLNLRTAPEVKEEKGVKTYTFSFQSLKASTSEWGTDATLLPHLFFSAAKDFNRAYFPFVGQKAFTYAVTPDMQSTVDKLKNETDDPLHLALNIQKMVVHQLGSWRLPLHQAGFICRTPEEVWNSNAGTKIEKTVLLAALLQASGLRAVPVAAIPGQYFDESVGSLYVMKDFGVQVKLDDETIYLSADYLHDQDLAYSFRGNKLLILDGAIESVMTFDPPQIKTEIIYQGKMVNNENEKLEGELNIKLTGAANPYFGLSKDTSFAKRYAQGVQDVDLKMLNPNESAFTLDLVIRDVFQEYGDYIFVTVFEARQGTSSWGFPYIETGRQAPIRLKDPIAEKYFITIEIPEGYELVSPSPDISIDNAVGRVKISTSQNGKLISVQREIEMMQEVIGLKEFDLFNAIWQPWMNPSLKELVFKKAK